MVRIKRRGVVVALAAILCSAPAFLLAEPIELKLWQDGPPDTNGLTGPEIKGGCLGNVSEATLKVFLPPADKATGAAVVITPGGGYGRVCVNHEGADIAKHLIERGIAGIVLKYRLPNGHHAVPANDARRAIRTVRAKATEWKLDPKRVGVWGFSAGGHLASTVSTVFDDGDAEAKDLIERQGSRPDFSILFYPVISFDESICHKGSRKNLTGGDAALYERYSGERNVTEKTPPTFLLHCTDDKVVIVENSLRYYEALIRKNVPATCVIYEKGGHGGGAFGKNPSWSAALDDWFKQRKCLP